MGRADSPLRDRMIFNLGARRSGTWWLQRIVTAHPDVAAIPSETHLFSHGIRLLMERFHHGARDSTQVGVMYADRELLLDATREFCDRVFTQWLGDGTRRLAERTPLHVLHVDLIADVFPDAWLVHIIRDGRDVTRSLKSRHFGPETIEQAAREWRSSVEAGIQARGRGRYVEVRYEDLLADPARHVRSLYERLGLTSTPELVEVGLAEAKVHANVDPAEPRVGSGKWRAALTPAELDAFERVAGDLLTELGYVRGAPRGEDSARATSPPRRESRARAAVRRISKPRRRGSRLDARPAPRLQLTVQLVNRLLASMHEDRLERLGDLVEADLSVQLVDDRGRRQVHGSEALEELRQALRDDPVLRGRQIRGDLFPSGDGVAAVTSYELPDGSREERLLLATQGPERLRNIVLYRFPRRNQSP